MSASVFKLIALLTMLIDHVGYRFFPQHPGFRMLGRISFPIYCFLLVQGFVHTKSRRNYLLRLLAFALLSEIPYQLFISGTLRNPLWGSNIFFELALGIGAMFFLDKAERGNGFWGVVPAFMCVAAEYLNLSYGAYGIALISLLYLFRGKKLQCMLVLGLCTLAYCLYFGSPLQGYAAAAGLLFLFYNGQKGRPLPKYIFYMFYPVHLYILYLLHCIQK